MRFSNGERFYSCLQNINQQFTSPVVRRLQIILLNPHQEVYCYLGRTYCIPWHILLFPLKTSYDAVDKKRQITQYVELAITHFSTENQGFGQWPQNPQGYCNTIFHTTSYTILFWLLNVSLNETMNCSKMFHGEILLTDEHQFWW